MLTIHFTNVVPDSYFVQPQFGTISWNGVKSRWPHRDKGLLYKVGHYFLASPWLYPCLCPHNFFRIPCHSGNYNWSLHIINQHPSVVCMHYRDVLTQRPENIRDFAADWFTKPHLKDSVHSQLKQRENSLREARFNRKL